MNQNPDEPGTTPVELSAAQEESVRRLLAGARETEPMPEDIRRRLEGVLHDLADRPDERAAPTTVSPVLDLAARRRRRAATVLVAAAAVTVFGVALPQLLQGTGADRSSPTSTSAESDAGLGAAQEESSPDLGDAPLQAPADQGTAEDSTAPEPSGAPTLRADRFAADARAVRDRVYLTGSGELSAFGLAPDCLGAADRTAAAKRNAIAVRYAGRDAALLLGKPVDGTQRVVLYVCGEAEPRRTAVLTAR